MSFGISPNLRDVHKERRARYVEYTYFRRFPKRILFGPEAKRRMWRLGDAGFPLISGRFVHKRLLEPARLKSSHASPTGTYTDGIFLCHHILPSSGISRICKPREELHAHLVAFEISCRKCIIELESVDEINCAHRTVLRPSI